MTPVFSKRGVGEVARHQGQSICMCRLEPAIGHGLGGLMLLTRRLGSAQHDAVCESAGHCNSSPNGVVMSVE